MILLVFACVAGYKWVNRRVVVDKWFEQRRV
jgi:hypothetical protein